MMRRWLIIASLAAALLSPLAFATTLPLTGAGLPTASCTANTNTQLLLHMTGADNGTTFTDSSTNAFVPTVTAAVTHSTSFVTPKTNFGPSSGKFNGAAKLVYADNANLRPGAGDFTWAWWENLNTLTGQFGAFGIGSFGANSINLQTGTDTGKYIVWLGGTQAFTQTTAAVVGTWRYMQLSRSGTTVTMYVNAVSDGSLTGGVATTTISDTAGLNIGNRGDSSSPITANLDEFLYTPQALSPVVPTLPFCP